MAGSGPIKKFTKGREISTKFHELVPGASHTYSKGEDQFPFLSPQIMSHAKGSHCWDVDGNKYIDWAMGNRVMILGHANPTVNEAVKREIDKGVNFTRPGILEYEVAEFLTDLWPVAEMVKFGKNGSDVTHAAIKLSRAYTGRKFVAYCKDHPFFGIGDWFISSTPCNSGIPDEIGDLTLTFRYNDLESVKELFANHPKKIACLILEPVKNEAPRDNFLSELKALCEKEGTVLIFDEMISGVRFDIKGAHNMFKVTPHLATFGKCISNGFSFSVLAGRKDILELGGLKHDQKRVFLLSQTHSSEAVGLAAVLATLKECIRLDVTSHVWSTGKKMVEGFNKLTQEMGVGLYVRIVGYDCNPQIVCTKENGEYWPELHTSFHEEVISYGVLIPWISITFSHTDEDLNKTFEALKMGLIKVKRIIETNSLSSSYEGEIIKPVFRMYNHK